MKTNFNDNFKHPGDTAIRLSGMIKQWSTPLQNTLRIIFLIFFSISAASCDKASDKDSARGVGVAETTVSAAEYGNYHALVIGINDYDKWPNLKFAAGDAKDIQNILISQYAFPKENVTYLGNKEATREGILKALRLKLLALGENDNLLVFYAGHGQLDTLTGNGYWIPSNADLYEEYTWISSSTLHDQLVGPGVKAKTVMVVADACFAGGLLKRAGPSSDPVFTQVVTDKEYNKDDYEPYRQHLLSLVKKKSRQVIASGGFEEVPDKSDFAAALKHALKSNPYPIIDMELLFFKDIFPEVKIIGQQDPALSRLKTGPDFDGQFLLVKKSESRAVAPLDDTMTTQPVSETTSVATETDSTPDSIPDSKSEPAPGIATLTVRSNVVGDSVFINNKNMGSTRLDLELKPGTYNVRVEKKGYKTYEQQVVLAAGDKPVIHASLESEQAPLPIIDSYEIKPSSIKPGESATLSWRTSNSVAVKINGIGDVALSGTVTIKPGKTQSYTIVARNSDGNEVMTEAGIKVLSVAAPLITRFSAMPDTVLENRTTVLNWQTSNAEQVEIEGIGVVPATGLKRVKPSATTTYKLKAKNVVGQTAEQSITVQVNSTLAEIGFFRASQKEITKGTPVTLQWKTLNADSVEIKPLGRVTTSGTKQLRPGSTVTYLLVASNKAGTQVSEKLTIVVKPALTVFTPLKPVIHLPGLKTHASDDLIWQNNKGQVYYWPELNGKRTVNIHVPVTDDWRLIAAADVDGDGTDDLIWQNKNGQVHYWPMKKGLRTAGIDILAPDTTGSRLVTTGDVDGDGTDDLIWHNRNGQLHYWPMKNGKRIRDVKIDTPATVGWRLITAGDVDGDGTDDLIWQNRNGQVHYWPMKNGKRIRDVKIDTPTTAGWRLIAAGHIAN